MMKSLAFGSPNAPNALLTVAEMGEADRLAIASGIPGVELMEHAGRAVALEITKRWSPRPVTILCGRGGNGGDGFVVARHLEAAGWPVRLGLLGPKEGLRGDAAHHATLWSGPVEALDPMILNGAELVVDALFGAGLDRKVEGAAAAILAAAAALDRPIVAIDVPSGVTGDGGADLGAVAATLTVTFFRKKPGHLLLPGRALCGETIVADIGIPPSILATIKPTRFENDPGLWLDALPRPTLGGNKYTRGHALIVGGYPTTGAARMAARAAARAGVGLTTVAVPEVAFPIYASVLESVMVKPLAAVADFTALLADPRFSGFLIGPGAGVKAETRERALACLATGRPTVLDADALTIFQDDPARLFEAIKGPCVMTPHEGEFRRLFDVTGNKISRATAAATMSGAVILLKGADTVIASPDGMVILNANAPPTLATAGAGDVLCGIILGLIAQAMPPLLAAAAGAWLHGAAADVFGPGLIAEDLPDLLPTVLRGLHPTVAKTPPRS